MKDASGECSPESDPALYWQRTGPLVAECTSSVQGRLALTWGSSVAFLQPNQSAMGRFADYLKEIFDH